MYIKKVLLVLSIMPALAVSQTDDGLPFAPAQASQQEQVTSRSLQEEFDQFRAFSQGLTAETRYEVTQRKFTQAKLLLDRAQKLLSAGTITEVRFAAVYYEYRQLETDMIRLPVEIIQAKLTAQFHKLRVLEEGNPGTHHEPELVQAMLDGLDSELQTLSSSLTLANVARQLAEKYWQHGLSLSKKGVLAPEQLELREIGYLNSVSQVKGLERQINLVKTAQASLQLSQERLRPGK